MTKSLTFEAQAGSASGRISLEVPPTVPTTHHTHRFMAREKRGLHQQARQAPCPSCGKRFKDVLRHLNHRSSKCAGWFTLPLGVTSPPRPQRPKSTGTIDDEPPPTGDPEPTPTSTRANPRSLRTDFPNASMIYGRAKSFIDRFNDDKYALRRVDNPYYPFADQEEWELGSFLLRSGMSMQKVDEFLRLKLVRATSRYPFALFTDQR